jgi:peroxiredoxin Q/BCP
MAKELKVGDRAPDIELPDESGDTVRLKELKGKQVVLYFYPKDDTPGCTKEACSFRDSESAVKKTGAVVLGVSMDGQLSHQRFVDKFKLPFRLLSDEDAKVAKAYGAYKLKNMYGRTYWGIERSTFVIDQAGKLKAIFRKVKVDGHTEDVLKALKS